jgi:hypothetical protein
MGQASQEAASALESDSVTNRVRRLTEAQSLLADLRLNPGRFGRALARWSPLIDAALAEARREQQAREPIPQVYIVDGRPIAPAHRPDNVVPFKGRAALFRQLEQALGGGAGERTTFVLYGQRRTGKTSALYQLPRRLGSRITPAFLDLQGMAAAERADGLLQRIAQGVLDEARRHRGQHLPAINPKYLRSDPYPAFQEWLDQVERALEKSTLLLCLDEYEKLEEAMQAQRRDGRDLIEQPVDGFPPIYTPAAVEHILHLTHCQPFLVQLVCGKLVQCLNEARRQPPDSYATPDDVQAVADDILAQPPGYFHDLWHSQTGSALARRVLERLAHAPGEALRSEKLRQLDPDSVALREAIKTLREREIIARTDDDGYRVTVPLIAAYVRRETTL